MSDWRQTNPNHRKNPRRLKITPIFCNDPYNTYNSNNPHNQNNADNPSTSDNNKITPKPLTTLI